jgi:hypothetical protein
MSPENAKFVQFLKANSSDAEFEIYLQMLSGNSIVMGNAPLFAAKFAALQSEYAKTLSPAEQKPEQPAQAADESDIRLGKPYGVKAENIFWPRDNRKII